MTSPPPPRRTARSSTWAACSATAPRPRCRAPAGAPVFVADDGGILDNIPLGRALDAVAGARRRPAHRSAGHLPPARRQRLGAPLAAADAGRTGAVAGDRRSTVSVLRGMMRSRLGDETINADIAELERQNADIERAIAIRRSTYTGIGDAAALVAAAKAQWPGYRAQPRRWRTPARIARLLADPVGELGHDPFPRRLAGVEITDERWRSPLADWPGDERTDLAGALADRFRGSARPSRRGRSIANLGVKPLIRVCCLLIEVARYHEAPAPRTAADRERSSAIKAALYRTRAVIERLLDAPRELMWVAATVTAAGRGARRPARRRHAADGRRPVLVRPGRRRGHRRRVPGTPGADLGDLPRPCPGPPRHRRPPRPRPIVPRRFVDVRPRLLRRRHRRARPASWRRCRSPGRRRRRTPGGAARPRLLPAATATRRWRGARRARGAQLLGVRPRLAGPAADPLRAHVVGEPHAAGAGVHRVIAAAEARNLWWGDSDEPDEQEGIHVDLKLAGNELANFSAFLLPEWRANDWMWGQLDAVPTLVDQLVTARSVRRLLDEHGNDVEAVTDLLIPRRPPVDGPPFKPRTLRAGVGRRAARDRRQPAATKDSAFEIGTIRNAADRHPPVGDPRARPGPDVEPAARPTDRGRSTSPPSCAPASSGRRRCASPTRSTSTRCTTASTRSSRRPARPSSPTSP